MMDNLKEIARNLNIEEKVYFVGYLAGKEVQKMQYSQVHMSLFGIVALEGMLRRNSSCCIRCWWA